MTEREEPAESIEVVSEHESTLDYGAGDLNDAKKTRRIPDDVDNSVSLRIERDYERNIAEEAETLKDYDRKCFDNALIHHAYQASNMSMSKLLREKQETISFITNILSNRQGYVHGHQGRSGQIHSGAQSLAPRNNTKPHLRYQSAEQRAYLHAINRELSYREERIKNLEKRYGIKAGVVIPYDKVKEIYLKTFGNDSGAVKFLDKVIALNKRLGVIIESVAETKANSIGVATSNREIGLSVDGLSKTINGKAELPVAILHEPILVFKSDRDDVNGKVVLIEATDNDGNNIVVAINLEGKHEHLEVNDITSLYGKEGYVGFVKWAEKGLIEDGDIKKLEVWIKSLPNNDSRGVSKSELQVLTAKLREINDRKGEEVNELTKDNFNNKSLTNSIEVTSEHRDGGGGTDVVGSPKNERAYEEKDWTTTVGGKAFARSNAGATIRRAAEILEEMRGRLRTKGGKSWSKESALEAIERASKEKGTYIEPSVFESYEQFEKQGRRQKNTRTGNRYAKDESKVWSVNATSVSGIDGAKVIKDLEEAKNIYEKSIRQGAFYVRF